MRFSFVGKLSILKKNGVRTGKTKNGADYKSVRLMVSTDKKQTGFVETPFGMVYSKIVTYNTDNQKIEVNWDDRFDEDVVSSVASYRKYTVRACGIDKVFISAYDFNCYLEEHISEFTDRVRVIGDIKKNVYNGSINNVFEITGIYDVKEDTKDMLRLHGTVYFTKDDIDTSDWKSDKKILVNAYTREYIDADHKDNYVSQQFVFDASRLDLENEKHLKILNFRLKQLGLKLDGNKITNELKANKVYTHSFVVNYVNGAEEIEFTENELTEQQKEAIELGIATLDDFKPSGNIYGNRVIEYKIIDFDLKTFTKGLETAEDTMKEFTESIFNAPKPESIDDIIDESGEDEEEDNDSSDDEDSDDFDDIFG